MKKEIKFYAITSITQATEKDSLYALKSPTDTTFKLIVTDLDGNVVHLKDLTGSSSSGILSIVSNDSSIDVSGTSTIKNIQVSPSLQNLISSALQPNANITELFNNAGYITIADIPVFTPSDYDLSNFTNINVDPFIRESDLPTTYPPSSHTHVEVDIIDLDKYTKSETDNLLDQKFDKPIGNNTQYLDGTGIPTTFPSIPSGVTNLAYTPSSTQGVVTSDTGMDAIIPLANTINAGLLSASEKELIANALQKNTISWIRETTPRLLSNSVVQQKVFLKDFYAKANKRYKFELMFEVSGLSGALGFDFGFDTGIESNFRYTLGTKYNSPIANSAFSYITTNAGMINTSASSSSTGYFVFVTGTFVTSNANKLVKPLLRTSVGQATAYINNSFFVCWEIGESGVGFNGDFQNN